MRRIFGGVRYANVTATLALIVALGGTSYAAISLPANSVGAKQIKSNAVRTSDVKNRSLLGRDFRRGELSLRGYKSVVTSTLSVPPGGHAGATVECPAGKKALGGGVHTTATRDVYVIQSGPILGYDDRSGWLGRVQNVSPSHAGFTVSALCADVK